ncbi:hypothetical protein [Mycolicibacterium sp.]|uniref:hypothetical protein n=1 Tax=Mycolicibacterium sp. TaxID=2320850 RepID=UPI001A1FF5AB|nr:hypothetical protein [Mycolicibacterium sp.]MBJ7339179.1 hypothetical protein [Mycolicibacterium sp.]
MSAPAPLLVNAGAAAPGSDQGVVSVHRLGLGNTTAWCSCGWAGHRRLLSAAAEQDAWAHSMQDGCMVSFPLVLSW